jgi:hypothetical protein
VPQTPITPDIHQALDIHRNFSTEVALDAHLLVDDLANAIDLVVRQIAHASIGAHIRPLEQFLARMEPNTKDVRQGRFDSLVAR